jgi:hypothetical protein
MASRAQFDLSGVTAQARAFQRLPESLQRQVVVRTQATLRRRVLPLLKGSVREDFNIGARNLDKVLTVVVQGDAVIAYGDRRRLGLEQFGGRYAGRKSAGATAQIQTGAGRNTYGSAFIIKGRRAIWARKLVHEGRRLAGTLSRGARAGRFPIVRLHGPGAVEMVLGDPRYQIGMSAADRTALAIGEVFSAEVERQLALANRRSTNGK